MFDSNKKIVYQDTLDEYHKRISALIGTGGSQISTIPTASEDYENVIYQYIGATNATYTNGYFYKCIEDPNNTGEYIWVNEQVQDGGSSSGGGHEIEVSSYSTEEKIVGTWIDGRPLWQKTVNIGTLPNTTSKEVNHNISNIENIISYTGVAINNGASLMIGYCGNYPNHEADIGIVVSTSKIYIQTYNDRSAYKNTYITLQYTKTTDA